VVTIVKVADFKIGDYIYINNENSAFDFTCENVRRVMIVGICSDGDYDFLVEFFGDDSTHNFPALVVDTPRPDLYGIGEDALANIYKPGELRFAGITLDNIESKKVMRSKLADKLYKNFKKHGETEEYFYVSKDI